MSIKSPEKGLLVLTLALVMCVTSLVMPAAAVENSTVDVRVNGHLVEFPDQQPVVNSANRTLIPVRFVAEELGADVKWERKTSSAIISKDGTTITLPVGSKEMKVTDASGKTNTVTMDTEAVIINERTMVPIRFVAEALGAYVDYSSAYQTVGIYLDKLTADQIKELRSYKYTFPEEGAGYTYEEAKAKYDSNKLAAYYGTTRHTFGEFANAHEYLFRYSKTPHMGVPYPYKDLSVIKTAKSSAEFYENVIKEAESALNYSSQNVTIKFVADTSCLYHSNYKDGLFTTVRGYLSATVHGDWRNFTVEDHMAFVETDFRDMSLVNKTQTYAVDVHMYTADSVQLNSVVALTDIVH